MSNNYEFLFNKTLSSRQKAEMLGLDEARIMENMLKGLYPRLDSKFGLYSQFMADMDADGIEFNYSRQQHSQEFMRWILDRHEFHPTDRGVVLREKSGIFRKAVIAEIYKHYDYLKLGSPECDMAKAIDEQGMALLKKKHNRWEHSPAVFGGTRRRGMRRHRKTYRNHLKRLVRR